MTEEQATETTAMSTTPPLESNSANATDNNQGDDDFAYETAESSDIKSNDDCSPDEEDPAAAAAPSPVLTTSSINEEEFFDAAPFESDNYDSKGAEGEAAAELNQPEVDLFSTDDQGAVIPTHDALAAVELEGSINHNNFDDNADPFSAFDDIVEGGDQNEASHANKIAMDEFGEFEGTGSNTFNTIDNVDKASGADGSLVEPKQNQQGAGEATSTPIDTFSAFDAFSEIQDAPLPGFGSASGAIEVEKEEISAVETTDPVFGATAMETCDDDFGEFSEGNIIESAPDEEKKSINEDELAFTSPIDNDTNEEGKNVIEAETTTPEEEVAAQIPDVSLEEAPTNFEAACEGNNGDVFGAFENVPIQPLEDSTAKTIAGNSDDLIEVVGAVEAKIPSDDGNKEVMAMEDIQEARDEGFGFTSFEAAIPVEGMTTDEIGEDTKDDNAPVDPVVEETDIEGNADTSLAEEDIPIEEDTALAAEIYEKGSAVDDKAIKENDGFGDFSAPTEEEEVHVDADTSPTGEDNAFGEAAVEERDDFGAFSAFTEGNVEVDTAHIEHDTPVEEHIALAEQDISMEEDTALAAEIPEKDSAFDDTAIKENDDFGDFSAPTEEEVPVDEEDNTFGEAVVEESDDFGAFSAFDTAHTEQVNPVEEDSVLAEQDFPAEEDTTLAAETSEKQTAFDDTAVEESIDNFGDFSAPLQEEPQVALGSEDDNAFDVNAVEESDDFGDFTASRDNTEMDTVPVEAPMQDHDFDDFRGFAANPVLDDEALEEQNLPDVTDVGFAEHDTIEDNDGFGAFSAHVGEEATPLEVNDALAEKDEAPPETTTGENDDFGDFSAHVLAEPPRDTTPVAPDVVENDNFGDFTAPPEELTSPAETAVNESDDFGDFGGFSYPATEVGVTSTATEGADDDFGNFGDFSAPLEVETEIINSDGPLESHEPVDAQPIVEEDDDFGDFAAFEEAAPAEIPENQQPSQGEDKAIEENAPTPHVQSSSEAVSVEEDEFGDFGDFEESDKVAEEASGESEPSESIQVLNENVRVMFQQVFKLDNAVNSEKGDGCTQLPFDVPMRTVLAPRKSNTEEKDESHTYKSEKEIKDITNYIDSLPTSPPSTILSEEKWYPYSQYVFHSDGTPYAGKTNLISVSAPSVPEVLSIELPTGFDARTFSPSSTSSSPQERPRTPTQSVRPIATMVDFPSADTKMTEEDMKEAAEDDDFAKLSDAGKKFMEQLPDLSYMLQPTLSSVK